jgi:exosortase/archaeosortase family protein
MVRPLIRPFEDRATLFAFCGLIAAINGYATALLISLTSANLVNGMADLFGVSAIIWFAFYCIARIGLEPARDRSTTAADGLIATLMLIAAFLPVVMAGSAAVLGGGLWLWWHSSAATRERRIAILLLALSGTMIWGKVFLMVFGHDLLALDGRFVGWLAGAHSEGNLVYGPAGSRIVIGAPCSSLHNMSLALLVWASVSQVFNLRLDRRLILFGLAGMAGVLVVNGIRLALIARFPAHFDSLHDGAGGMIFGLISLLVAMMIAGWGAIDATKRSH